MSAGQAGPAHPTLALEPIPPLGWPQLLRLGATGIAVDFRDRHRDPALRKRPSARALDPRLHQPIFIIGSPRSGTTFLGACIGRMPEVSYHFEPRLTKAVAGRVYDGSWSEGRSRRLFRTSYSTLLLAALHGGRRFAEKTPENSFLVPFLAAAFPDAQFVHIIRDGRDAAVSHAEKPWLTAAAGGAGRRGPAGEPRGPYPRWWVEPDRGAEFMAVPDIVRAGWAWRRFTAAALEGLSTLAPERVIEVRYEWVVSDPMGAAESLGEFLGASAAGREGLRAGLGNASKSSVGRWRTILNEQEIADLERHIGPMLTRLGYATESGAYVPEQAGSGPEGNHPRMSLGEKRRGD
jgi:Sulfotransferase family